LYTAIECRDLSRKITVNQVEGFSQKCDDTGVSKKVMVSSLGFWKSAKDKAKHLHVSCLTLHEAKSLDWFMSETFRSFSSNRRVTTILLIPKIDPPRKPVNFTLFDKSGAEFTQRDIEKNIHYIVNQQDAILAKEGIHPLKIRLLMDGCTMRDDDTGDLYELSHANVYSEVEVISKAAPFRKLIYEDVSAGARISELAIAKIDGGNVSGDLVFSHNQDGNITVSFVPSQIIE
jgi:hypothetical protein